jgi:UDP-glucose 4-epimerase
VQRRLVLRSAGLQIRDFVTLHDVARALSHCIDLPEVAIGDGLFNVGGDCPMRIIDLAREIATRCMPVLGFTPGLEHPLPSENELAESHEYDISKFKATGFALAGSHELEIDNTLRLCQAAFGASS